MPYSDAYNEDLTEKLAKLRKKDPVSFQRVEKKVREVLEKPKHEYKNLRYDMSELKRVQIGHFVLVFHINHESRTVQFVDYDHHDKIYGR